MAQKDKKIKLPKRLSKRKRKEIEIKRQKKYLKFMRNNHEWDYWYIIDLLRYKIKKVRKYIKNHEYLEEQTRDKIVSQMLEAENLLKRVVSYDYTAELDQEFSEKFGGTIKLKLNFKKKHVVKVKRDYSDVNIELLQEAIIEFNKMSDNEFERRKADLRKAFDLITENIWNWWD